MSLRITVIPASTQAGKGTITELLGHERETYVHGIYRDPSKAPSEFVKHPRFKAIKGDVSRDSELDLTGSDAVYYIPPPTYDGSDSAEFARNAAINIKAALWRAPSVKRLLILSAIGAQHDKDIGILVINHVSDDILKNSVKEVVIAKAGFFMENWASAFETIEADQPFFESYITPLDHKIAMESIGLPDIGKICAQKLLETGQSLPSVPHIFDLHGPRNYSTIDIREALETITGKSIKIAPIAPNELFDFYRQKVTAPYAQELVEMTTAFLPGGLVDVDMNKTEGILRGELEPVDVLRNIARGETIKVPSGVF